MFDFIRGTLEEKGTDYAVVCVGGIGFHLNISLQTAGALSTGSEVKVYTYMCVREDDISLYGFATAEEKSVFMMLISVSGVGPKVALAILSGITPGAFGTAVVRGDYKQLNKIKGVGSKTAQRIVLELKDKIGKEMKLSEEEEFDLPSVPGDADTDNEAVEALMVLGYTAKEASSAVRKVYREGMTIDETIKAALMNRVR